MILEGSHNKTGTVCNHWTKAVLWKRSHSGKFSFCQGAVEGYLACLWYFCPIFTQQCSLNGARKLPPVPPRTARSWAFSCAPGRQHCPWAAPLCCSASSAVLQGPVGTQNLGKNSLLHYIREDVPQYSWYLPISASKS